nr:IS110 family transposase [Paenibacillus terrae]
MEEQGKKLAKMELQRLLTLYEFLQEQITELHARMNELLKEISYSNQPLAMKGIGRDTAVGFLADIQEYLHPRQISKLAGLNLRENTSGKHKGQTKITKRGRKGQRALLFRGVTPLVAKNPAFKALHE